MPSFDGKNMVELLFSTAVPFVILNISDDSERDFIEHLYLEHRMMMYRVARKYFGNQEAEIEDAIGTMAELMCRYADKIRRVDCNKIQYYLLSMTENVCRRQVMLLNVREAHLDFSLSAEEIEDHPDTNDPYASVFEAADAQTLMDSLDCLNEKEKMLLQLRYIEQYDFAEIASFLHMSEGAIRTALTRVKQCVIRSLSSKGGKEK